ncbi:MAG: glycosyltransferase [Phycisphaerae bacterium]|nr:glycosyltransferase [Phycisphaerae bacterium]
MDKPNDIVMIWSTDFDALWYQRQALAVYFAKAGHRVFYFNKTPHRWPGTIQVAKWLVKKRKKQRQQNLLPENPVIVNPFWLLPIKKLRIVNRKLIEQTLKKLDVKNAVIVTDVPSYNTLDAIEKIQPERIVYLNVHNYDDSSLIVTDILHSEKQIVQQADFLFATSEHNAKRTARISGGRKVFRSLPGVDFALFSKALRNDESQKKKTIYFFGSIHDSVEIKLYNRLAEQFRIVLIGETTQNIKKNIADTIEVRPTVSQKELAEQLKDADILGLFYNKTPYSRGVIPAKIFECLATGKPILVSGIEKDPVYSPFVYHFDGTEQAAIETIKNLPNTETREKIKLRQTAGEQADWQKRFETFHNIIFSNDGSLPKFSVLISVYEKDRPEYFQQAMESIVNQTIKSDQIVLVKDGPVGEDIENLINRYKKQLGALLKVVNLETNKGRGVALAEGVKNCTFDIVALMDADDISLPMRFEKQLNFLKNNPDIDVASCFLAAFEQNPEKVLFVRRGPLSHEDIVKQFRFRFCMNHATSMFRKKAVLNAGNYTDFGGLQDYHLWARMILSGAKMAAIGQVLYCHRWEQELLKRRSGLRRAAQQIKLQREFLRIGFINTPQFLRNTVIRSIAAIAPWKIIRKFRVIFGI